MSRARLFALLACLAALALWERPTLGMKASPGRIWGSFRIELPADGLSAVFREIDGMSATLEVVDYKEGGLNTTPHRIVGDTRYANLTLQSGQTLPEMIEAELRKDGKEADELLRLEQLLARIATANSFHVMLVNFDVRAGLEAPEPDQGWMGDMLGDATSTFRDETFIVTLGVPIPDPIVLDNPHPEGLPPPSKKLKGFFNPRKDTPGRLALVQQFSGDEPGRAKALTALGSPSLCVEALFDGTDARQDVRKDATKRMKRLAALPFQLKRPPRVRVDWGPALRFEGGVKGLSVTYTTFLPDGTATRGVMDIDQW